MGSVENRWVAVNKGRRVHRGGKERKSWSFFFTALSPSPKIFFLLFPGKEKEKARGRSADGSASFPLRLSLDKHCLLDTLGEKAKSPPLAAQQCTKNRSQFFCPDQRREKKIEGVCFQKELKRLAKDAAASEKGRRRRRSMRRKRGDSFEFMMMTHFCAS